MRHRLAAPTTPFLPIDRFAVPFDENTFVDWLIDANPGGVAFALVRGEGVDAAQAKRIHRVTPMGGIPV